MLRPAVTENTKVGLWEELGDGVTLGRLDGLTDLLGEFEIDSDALGRVLGVTLGYLYGDSKGDLLGVPVKAGAAFVLGVSDGLVEALGRGDILGGGDTRGEALGIGFEIEGTTVAKLVGE
jgi:hypothetical protein